MGVLLCGECGIYQGRGERACSVNYRMNSVSYCVAQIGAVGMERKLPGQVDSRDTMVQDDVGLKTAGWCWS